MRYYEDRIKHERNATSEEKKARWEIEREIMVNRYEQCLREKERIRQALVEYENMMKEVIMKAIAENSDNR